MYSGSPLLDLRTANRLTTRAVAMSDCSTGAALGMRTIRRWFMVFRRSMRSLVDHFHPPKSPGIPENYSRFSLVVRLVCAQRL